MTAPSLSPSKEQIFRRAALIVYELPVIVHTMQASNHDIMPRHCVPRHAVIAATAAAAIIATAASTMQPPSAAALLCTVLVHRHLSDSAALIPATTAPLQQHQASGAHCSLQNHTRQLFDGRESGDAVWAEFLMRMQCF